MNSMKVSRADIRVKMESFSEVLGTNSLPIFTLKMETEFVTETPENHHILTRMYARENFTEHKWMCCIKSTKRVPR